MKSHHQKSKKSNGLKLPMKYVALFTLVAAASQLLVVNCQASDGDEQFQAYHHDIGRISGSATRAAVAAPTQTVLRQLNELPAEVPEQRAPIARVRGPAQVATTAARKPNRITLAVQTHAPIQVSAIGSEALTSPHQHQHQNQNQHEQQQGGGQQSPFVPLAAPSFQPTFQSLTPADNPQQPAAAVHHDHHPSGHQRSLSTSVSARHSALMAQVAAERHQLIESAQASPPTIDQSSSFASSQSPSSAVAAQVQPPPVLLHQHQHQHQQQQQQQAAGNSPALTFVNQPEEPQVAPSFEQVLGSGCPTKGVFSWENKDYCDRYYMCTNGTFTEEACPNGLGYSQMGAVYQHCAYNWNVNCGNKKVAEPLASPGCPWQFGIFPVASAVGRCSIDYFVCEWGVPETKRCSPEGLFYDDRIKGCQWADQLGCKSEAILNFKCPPEDEDNPYWPYPRYYHTKQDVIVCVNEQPRLVHCNEEQTVEPSSLACIDLKPKKLKKKL